MKKALCFDDVLLAPQHFKGSSRSQIDISTKIGNLHLDIPIIAANMPAVCEVDMAIALGKRGGLGIIHRMTSLDNQIAMVKEAKKATRPTKIFALPQSYVVEEPIQVGASIGIGDDWLECTQALVSAGADIICLDVAFLGQDRAFKVVKKYTEWFKTTPLIAGNISSFQHISDCEEDMSYGSCLSNPITYKVGIGSGASCKTRIATGCGLPTLASLLEIQEQMNPQRDVISDGGHKNSGDCVKALAAGAKAVMLGSLLAGTDQSPGEIIDKDGFLYKKYFGNASEDGKKSAGMQTSHIEGVSYLTRYKGDVNLVIDGLIDGIKSGLSYCGAQNLSQLRQKAVFVEITPAGYAESAPHGLK